MGNLLVERYAAGGPLLSFAVYNLTPAQEQARIAPGTLSIGELAVHLLDADLQFAHRLKQILAEDQPTLQGYDHDAWLARISADGLPAAEAAELFALHRRWTARILRRLEDKVFGRTGMHTANGRQTMAEILAYCVSHLDHHLKFIYGKRGNLGVALEPKYASNLNLPQSSISSSSSASSSPASAPTDPILNGKGGSNS